MGIQVCCVLLGFLAPCSLRCLQMLFMGSKYIELILGSPETYIKEDFNLLR